MKYSQYILRSCIGTMLLCLSYSSYAFSKEITATTNTTASVTFSEVSGQEMLPYNPFGPGYLEFDDFPGGVQVVNNEDLKLMWVSNFVFDPDDSGDIYDYLNQSTATPRDLTARVKNNQKDNETTPETITLPPLIQIWNSEVTGWDLKIKSEGFSLLKDEHSAANIEEDKIPMIINMSHLVRIDKYDQNVDVLPQSAETEITNFVNAYDNTVTLSNQSQNLISFKNDMKVSGFSTYAFQNETQADHKALSLTIPPKQKIQANKVYQAKLTWTLATRLKD